MDTDSKLLGEVTVFRWGWLLRSWWHGGWLDSARLAAAASQRLTLQRHHHVTAQLLGQRPAVLNVVQAVHLPLVLDTWEDVPRVNAGVDEHARAFTDSHQTNAHTKAGQVWPIMETPFLTKQSWMSLKPRQEQRHHRTNRKLSGSILCFNKAIKKTRTLHPEMKGVCHKLSVYGSSVTELTGFLQKQQS